MGSIHEGTHGRVLCLEKALLPLFGAWCVRVWGWWCCPGWTSAQQGLQWWRLENPRLLPPGPAPYSSLLQSLRHFSSLYELSLSAGTVSMALSLPESCLWVQRPCCPEDTAQSSQPKQTSLLSTLGPFLSHFRAGYTLSRSHLSPARRMVWLSLLGRILLLVLLFSVLAERLGAAVCGGSLSGCSPFLV